ncbi:beta-glucosidase family protein [Consotaella aegiceratis]|uniref:beta-glucosidase family protein n=1 Tax=Consotaella aegiceratis TaxID=3097961 RepID=UPI002F417B2B
MTWSASDEDLTAIVAAMTKDEKIGLLSGHGLWRTDGIERLGVPPILMTDGTYGVRYSVEQIDGVEAGRSQLELFLGVVNQGEPSGVEAAFGSTRPATCFPNGSSLACAWDVALAYELGEALAAECQAFGVNLLLGPGINIRRTPLAGRSYEYYSEDPMLTGDIAAAVIAGLQDNGVGAALKHFACNNSEVQRTTMDSVVDERALREIYLAGFKRAIDKSAPWTVMSSYNRLNGVQTAQSAWLLTEVLRNEWGYDGVVVSDWHGIKDRPAALLAGNDLDMPESGARKVDLSDAIADGSVTDAHLDCSCLRVLRLVRRAKNGERPHAVCDFDKHHALARRMAAESIVLLKNEAQLLPIDTAKIRRIAVVGEGAASPVIQGSGCATTRPTQVDVPLEAIRLLAGDAAVSYHSFEDFGSRNSESEQAVAAAEVVLVFANTAVGYDGEGSDRQHLSLDEGQDELIARLARVNSRIAVIVASPDAVEMPWIDQVAAVIATFFPGQGGGQALADVIFGEQNPCGKLTVTFPVRLEDTPGLLTYPGENDRHVYSEGIFVGYRYYDRRRIEPLFPFGFGLSYSSFAYEKLSIDADSVGEEGRLTVSFEITNTGSWAGKEIAQVYCRPHAPRLHRPVRELKGFAKVALAPGETKRVEVLLDGKDLRYFDPQNAQWLLDPGPMTIEIGASSRDIRLAATVEVEAKRAPRSRLSVDSQPYRVFEHAIARDRLKDFLEHELALGEAEAARVLDFCSTSFLGIYNTLLWAVGDRISKTGLAAVLERINEELSGDPT